MTALHWACSLNFEKLVKLFLKNENTKQNILDLNNQIPVEKAIYNGNFELVALLLNQLSTIEFKFRDMMLISIKLSNYEIFK